jgi:branched-chain amino acid transport system ATP-binding protein
MLETQDVSKSFGKLQALSGVSFQVEEGEIFGIAGPNGAGKSTLFNVITGIYPPSSGRVRFRSGSEHRWHDITRALPHQICHLGIGRTYQIPATFHTLSVYDNVRVGATFGRSQRKVDDILDFLQLTPQANAQASNLDLYTTKLVMLGAVLATDCRLLMLDEPMAGFSIVEINNFLQVLQAVNQEWKVTIVIIEHLLDILIGLTQRMMILADGSLLYLGPSSGVAQDRRVVEVYIGTQKERQTRTAGLENKSEGGKGGNGHA